MIRNSLPLLAAALIALPAPAQTLDEIVGRYVEARGGREAIEAVRSVRAEGRMMAPNGIEQTFLYEWKRPNKIRFELTFQGITEIQASDGTTAWGIEPPDQPEPQPLSPVTFAMLNDGVDYIGPLFDFDKKGHAVKLLGNEEVEGTPAFKLEVVKADGMVEHTYLDAEYFLEILQIEKHRLPNGQEMELEVTWGDYKEVGGVLLPHSWNRKPRGGTVGLTLMFDEIELNADIPDSRFAMPE